MTRAALAPPRATSPASQCGPSFPLAEQRDPRDATQPAGPGRGAPDPRARGRGRRSQSGFCAAPPGPLRRPRPPPPAAQARPHRPGLGRDVEAGAAGDQPPPPAATRPLPPGPPGTAVRGGGQQRPGSEQRRRRDRVCVRVCGDGGGARTPSPKSGGSTATHRNMFTH